LPYSLAPTHFEWRGRAQSLDMIKRFIQKYQPKSFLEIGGWNGWLTHHLAGYGAVTSVDFFADDADGLGAMKHYQARWERIQMDITDLTILDGHADMVIINNGVHLLANPLQTIRQAQNLVADGGVLVILEMPFYRNPSRRIAQLAQIEAQFLASGGVGSLFLYPTKGYFDDSDKQALHGMGVRLRPYPRYKMGLKALISPSAPMVMMGVWRKKSVGV
jgi:SAM-dependent methyltransferase